MGPTLVFRPLFGRVLTVAAGALVVLVAAIELVDQGVLAAVRAALVGAVLVDLIWLTFWRPRVEVSDGGIDIHNVTVNWHVPWPDYRGAECRWSLVVRGSQVSVTAWSAPRSSAAAAGLERRRARRLGPAGTPAAGGAGSRSDAESVAAAIEARHTALVAAGHLDGAARPGAPTARRDVPGRALLGLAALAVVAALAVAL